MTPNEAREIQKLLVDEINTGLRKKFKDPDTDLNNVYRYPLPFDWMPIASSIKEKYRDAGWSVEVTIEMISSNNRSERDCTLVFRTDKKSIR